MQFYIYAYLNIINIFANLHEMSTDQFNYSLGNNITKTYRETELIKTRIDKVTRNLSKPLKADNKIESYNEHHVFKDHKEDFKQNSKCRLINPAIGEIGRVSKMYLAWTIRDNLLQIINYGEILPWSLNDSKISPQK